MSAERQTLCAAAVSVGRGVPSLPCAAPLHHMRSRHAMIFWHDTLRVTHQAACAASFIGHLLAYALPSAQLLDQPEVSSHRSMSRQEPARGLALAKSCNFENNIVRLMFFNSSFNLEPTSFWRIIFILPPSTFSEVSFCIFVLVLLAVFSN